MDVLHEPTCEVGMIETGDNRYRICRRPTSVVFSIGELSFSACDWPFHQTLMDLHAKDIRERGSFEQEVVVTALAKERR